MKKDWQILNDSDWYLSAEFTPPTLSEQFLISWPAWLVQWWMHFPKFGSIMCYYSAAATTQSVCCSGDHKPFIHGSSVAGWLCWMRSSRARQQIRTATVLPKKERKMKMKLSSYQTVKIRHISSRWKLGVLSFFFSPSVLYQDVRI